MKRQLIAGIAAAAVMFGLAACGNSDSASGGSSASSSQKEWDGTMPTVEQKGEQTKLVFPKTGAPKELKIQVVEEGKGATVEKTDTVIANYVGQVWGKEEAFDSSFKRGAPTGFLLEKVIAGWTEGLAGQKVGSKVILVVPPDKGYGASGGNAAAGIGADDVIAFYVEIKDALGKDKGGDPQAKPETALDQLPVNIQGNLGGPVSVKVKDGAPQPTERKMTVIARGSGEPVKESGTTVYLQYAMSLWDNSTGETTYGVTGPQAIPVTAGSPFALLKDIPVGSRVLITQPGSEGTSSPKSPAFAVVVDIVGQLPTGK
ncbi:peptidylprolyl isomerase [Arcanobacterium pluranimalium]|uniref:FKBP-type peptidyl-prolyl cis-trans isomerase n=1 Tax=Arcanobacterium pluranimalium TaxID=108028 RepID=UPI001958DD2F|nr:peptidylprolyl isomerase [Arcanobacterium pluranimalium]